MRAMDRRSDSAKIHNLPTAQNRERGRGCFFNLITGSMCLIPNIDTGNRPREKLMKNWSKSTKFEEHWVFRVQDGHHRLIKPRVSELNLPTERLCSSTLPLSTSSIDTTSGISQLLQHVGTVSDAGRNMNLQEL